jgi:tetratricopeptide (TPR) repeat protein
MKRKIYCTGMCLIAAVVIFSGCSKSRKDEVSAYIKNARTFMSQNKPETAVIEYRNAVQLDPKNDVALFELAEAYIVMNKLGSAIRYYQRAADANPESIPPHLRLAQIYLQTDKLLKARAEVSKVLNLDPLSINAYHILSGIQIKERDLDAAVETLEKAASIDGKNIKTLISLAKLYIKTGKSEKAEKTYLKAFESDSASRDAYMGLVRMYAFAHKWDRIEKFLNHVIETPGIKEWKYTDLARFYQGRKKYDLAEENYQKAVLEAPEEVFPLIDLAEFYTKRGMKDKAIVTMKNALAKKKQTALVLTGLSQIYLHFKLIDKALETVNRALDINSEFIDAISQKGRVLMAKKDFKQALVLFDKVIAMDRVNAWAYYGRAVCIKHRGASDRPEQKIFRAAAGLLDNPEEFEKDQVKKNLLAAITIDPAMVQARIELAKLYLLDKNAKKAEEQIHQIFRYRGPDIENMTLLAGLRILEGKTDEAEKILKSIIDNRPGYTPAYIRLGLLYESAGNHVKALEYFQAAYDRHPGRLGLAKMMVDIYIKEKKYEPALNMISSLASGAGEENRSFFENLRGEIFLLKNNTDSAASYFIKSIALKPDYIKPRMHLAGLYYRNGDLDSALEQYKHVEKINHNYLPALLAMGFIYDSKKKFDLAQAYYRKVLNLDPKNPDAANNLAFILSEKPGKLEEAFRLAGIARQKRGKKPEILDTMGWIYYQKGNYMSARSELEESLGLKPDSALACYHYGMILYRMKEYEKARTWLKKALKLDPDFIGAETARRMLN